MNLKTLYLTTLARCTPELLVREHVDASMPRNVVAIGKCAGALLDGVAAVHGVEHAFVALPAGYKLPKTRAHIHEGGHPHITPASFAAGRALLEFVAAHDDILFLISGGGSACVEVPADGIDEQTVVDENEKLIRSGLPIGAINARRSELSRIKGGRLGARVKGHAVTLVYSDVSTGRLADVASGPSTRDLRLIADNTTLVRTAASLVDNAVIFEEQLECDVAGAARILAAKAKELRSGQILIAGGEPTVVVRGDGRGGRDVELAVRFALQDDGSQALFASSDGVDGNSGVAGIYLPRVRMTPNRNEIARALGRSDAFSIASQVGEPIMIAPAGNNLRDLFLVARD